MSFREAAEALGETGAAPAGRGRASFLAKMANVANAANVANPANAANGANVANAVLRRAATPPRRGAGMPVEILGETKARMFAA